ncbi:hypothetical protein ACA910_014347 [Epithemia clementina (nom. ined.)]
MSESTTKKDPPKTTKVKANTADDDTAFKHVTEVLLGLTPDLFQELQDALRYHKIPNLHLLTETLLSDDIDKNMDDIKPYKIGNKSYQLTKPITSSLRRLAIWTLDLQYQLNASVTNADWLILTKADYDKWRISTPSLGNRSGPPPPQTPQPFTPSAHGTPSSNVSSTGSVSFQELSNFRKGTKRDATAYKTFKDERYFETFWRVFKATAKAQGLANVIDPQYTPPRGDLHALELFTEQQIFLYSVLIKIIQTDQGRAFVRDHEDDEDAQAVIRKLIKHHTQSELAKREVIRLQRYITNLKLDDSWRGTTRQFLLHFQEQLRLLDKLVAPSERLLDHTRMTFLMQAVEHVPDLRRVKILDSMVSTKSGASSLHYSSYFNLLLDSAFDHDQAYKSKDTKRRHVQQHDFSEDYSFDPFFHLDHYEDITTNSHEDTVQIHNATFKPTPGEDKPTPVFIPSKVWQQLSPADQDLIKEYNRSIPRSPRPNKGPKEQRKAHLHDHTTPADDLPDSDSTPEADFPAVTNDDDPVIHMIHQAVSQDLNHPASNLEHIMSISKSKSPSGKPSASAPTKRQGNMARYVFSRRSQRPGHHQLVDRGANGGLAGSDMRILEKTGRHISIIGIDNHELTGLPIVTCATMLDTNQGPIIGIFNEYAYYGKGKSIHAPAQFEHFGLFVDDKSVKVGGQQRVTTLDGRALPLQVLDGLSYLKTIGTPSDSDMEKYPHIIFTAPGIWDPSILDHEHPDLSADTQPAWAHVDQDGSFTHDPYDWHGEYTERVVQNLNVLLDLPPDAGEYTPHYPDASPDTTSVQQLFFHHSTPSEVDWSIYRPFFGWAPAETIADTFQHTTQHGNYGDGQDYLKKHFKARNPVLNIPRRHEPVATDTIFSDTPAIDHGGKLAQVFVGRNTTVSDAYGIKSTKQFVNTLQDNIRQRGAMESLISDGGAALISQKVKDILRTLVIADYQSEPYHQHQNYAENRLPP